MYTMLCLALSATLYLTITYKGNIQDCKELLIIVSNFGALDVSGTDKLFSSVVGIN
jgi:hypothetical protein